MPIIFALFIIVCLIISHNVNKNSELEQKNNEEFWERERQSNFVRGKSTDDLPRITLPDNLPYEEAPAYELKPVMDKINMLRTKEIINLTGITNTELKMRYGLSNLDYLSECDGYFTILSTNLNSWSEWLCTNNRIADAKTVLEFAVSINVDITAIYLRLAEIYINDNQPERIDELINVSSSLNSITGKSIASKLSSLT